MNYYECINCAEETWRNIFYLLNKIFDLDTSLIHFELNDDADVPIPLSHVFTFTLLFNNACTL